MSFQRKALKLEWPEDHELHGLEVFCRRPRIEQVEMAETALEGERSAKMLAGMLRDTVGKALVGWNYTDESGEQVPATPDGFASLDIEAQLEILGMWTSQGVGVPAELGKESGSGPGSPARLTDGLPVVTNPGLSVALQNLTTHSGPSPSSSVSPATP